MLIIPELSKDYVLGSSVNGLSTGASFSYNSLPMFLSNYADLTSYVNGIYCEAPIYIDSSIPSSADPNITFLINGLKYSAHATGYPGSYTINYPCTGFPIWINAFIRREYAYSGYNYYLNIVFDLFKYMVITNSLLPITFKILVSQISYSFANYCGFAAYYSNYDVPYLSYNYLNILTNAGTFVTYDSSLCPTDSAINTYGRSYTAITNNGIVS